MGKNKEDIQSAEDVKMMVDTFYAKVNADQLLSPVFNGFAKVDWETHLPKMYGFWGNILLGTGDYDGRPFPKHIPLPIDKNHFDRWVSLFVKNVDEQFAGTKSEEAKMRARSIAQIFQSKLSYLK